MGAYSGIVLQLFLLGTFLYGLKIKEIKLSLLVGTLSQKFIIVPIISAIILSFTSLHLYVQGVIFMEMMTPLAVANINLASLYECNPQQTTSLILLSTLIFIPVIFILSYIVSNFYL